MANRSDRGLLNLNIYLDFESARRIRSKSAKSIGARRNVFCNKAGYRTAALSCWLKHKENPWQSGSVHIADMADIHSPVVDLLTSKNIAFEIIEIPLSEDRKPIRDLEDMLSAK